MKDNDNSVIMNAGKSNYDNAKDLRSVSVVLRKVCLMNTLKHAEITGLMVRNIVFYKMMGRRMRGIAKILYGMLFFYNANATLIHTHHFIKTLLVLEKARFAVWRGALKIRVSLVRFQSRPPFRTVEVFCFYGFSFCSTLLKNTHQRCACFVPRCSAC